MPANARCYLSRTEDAEGAEAFHYLAQRTRSARRIPDICTVVACCVSINHSMQGTCTWSVESPCEPTNECLPMRDAIYLTRRRGGRGGIPLSRTEDTEGAENPRYLYSRSLLRLNKSFHCCGSYLPHLECFDNGRSTYCNTK